MNTFIFIKEFVQPKLSLNNRTFLILKERKGGDREGHAGGQWVGQQAGILKVRIGLGEIEGRDRDTIDRETNKQRDIETELTIKIPSKAR